MIHGSLFSGIGGFDLAAQWMGWENAFHCEWNSFGQKVLKYYWPNAISYEDITKTDFTIHRGSIDIISGGFPCQPYSQAGKRLGKEDDRHLWPEMLRAIREIRPRWVVGENVRGLTNWNGGLVFDEVQADLENEGYEVTPFLLPACAVNAPHRRDRIWFIAHSSSNGHELRGSGSDRSEERESQSEGNKRERIWNDDRGDGESGIVADTDNGRQRGESTERERGEHQHRRGEIWSESVTGSKASDWNQFPTQSPLCDGDDGLSSRLDGITFPKWRNESIKAGGNAIVPQVVLEIFKAIQLYETNHLRSGSNHENQSRR